MTPARMTALCYACGSDRPGVLTSAGVWRCDACYTTRPIGGTT